MLIDIEYELAQNRRLDAIKMMKDHTKYPLRDCKNMIDGYIIHIYFISLDEIQ